MSLPDEDSRWTLDAAESILSIFDQAGYQRSDDVYVYRALDLLHEAAHVYAGEAAPGLPSRPQLSMQQYLTIQLARRDLTATLDGGAFLEAGGINVIVSDLRNLLAVVDELTGGGAR